MLNSFVTETELDEKRRKRQEEWERVRKPEDPVDVPEEEYDSRCLYDRLKEQKDKKQDEWDEAHKLKNMVRGLDDDEAGFLELVDRTKLAEETRIIKEEKDELEEYRLAVARESEERLLQEMNSQIALVPNKLITSSAAKSDRQSQRSKIIACVKRKSVAESSHNVKRIKPDLSTEKPQDKPAISKPALPGIGFYAGSSDSDSSDA